jgi:hypothetical protein
MFFAPGDFLMPIDFDDFPDQLFSPFWPIAPWSDKILGPCLRVLFTIDSL